MAESNNQPSNQNLQDYVAELLELANSESLPEEDIKAVRTSCEQAVSHTFEIAFAGLRSAGKSTTINALLDRELLYSQAGHATGTICYIRSLRNSDTEENVEHIKITFINQSQLKVNITELCNRLNIPTSGDVTQSEERVHLMSQVRLKQREQELPDRTAQSIDLLERLLKAYNKYQSYITAENQTIILSPLDEKNRKQAAEYAAWEKEGGDVGGGSVVERIDYYCHNPLLDSGNILIDLPGIDAPIERDRDLTHNRLKDEKTGAVVFMPSSAYEGALSQEEIELNTLIKGNMGIRSRVFFVFNRLDETWSDNQKKNKFEQSLSNDFNFLHPDDDDETKRIYCTSALLGFYTSLIQKYIAQNGIDSIDIPHTIEDGIEIGNSKIPKQYLISLVYFFRYQKNIKFESNDSTNNDVLAQEITEIVNKYLSSLQDVVTASGIPQFRKSIYDYVNHKKRPQLYQQLYEDLQTLCRQLREEYREKSIQLINFPKTTEELKATAKEKIREDLQTISNDFDRHMDRAYKDFVTGSWGDFATEFNILKQNTTEFLKDLIDSSDFSLDKLYNKAIFNRRNNYGTAPILSIFVEPFYLLSTEFQKFLVKESKRVTQKTFYILKTQIQKKDYYHNLDQLLGDDADLILKKVEQEGKIFVSEIENVATKISQQYIRESSRFYEQEHDDNHENLDSSMAVSFIEILSKILKSTKGKFGEPATNKDIEQSIRELFRVQFSTDEHELETLYSDFRLQINVSFEKRLESMLIELKDKIPQQFDLAVKKSDQRLESEARSKLNSYESLKADLQTKIQQYNQIIDGINNNQNWKSLQLLDLSTCEIEI